MKELGLNELKTPAEVDAVLAGKSKANSKSAPDSVLVYVNSMCGCAYASARPALKLALKHKKLPDKLTTVFAGQDMEATAKAREHFLPYPPSSPSFYLLKSGKVVFAIERPGILHRDPQEIAESLGKAFDEFC